MAASSAEERVNASAAGAFEGAAAGVVEVVEAVLVVSSTY